MKITDVEVDGFGVWNGLSIPGLSPQLNVFYGANEAGKTTLMQFVRAICYGFSPGRRERYLPPVHGGAAGGCLGLDTHEGRFRIVRHDSTEAQGPGEVDVVAADGTHASGQHLTTLLGDLDELTFNHVFVLGLREIQELGTLADGEAARLLYELTAGYDRVSLGEVLRELETSRQRLLSSDDRASQIAELLAARAKLQGEIEELAAAGRKFARLGGDRNIHLREIAQLENQIADGENQQRTVDAALAVADKWRRRRELDRQLGDSMPHDDHAAGVLDRLDALGERVTFHRVRGRRAAKRKEHVRQEIATLPIREPLARNAARIEALAEHEPLFAATEHQVEQTQAEIADLERKLLAEKHRLGLPADASAEQLHKAAGRSFAPLRAAARALREAHRGPTAQSVAALPIQPAPPVKLEAPRQPAAASPSLAAEQAVGRQTEAQHDLADQIEKKGQLVAQLRRRIQLDERLTQLGRHQRELESQSNEQLEKQLLPPKLMIILGCVFALGVLLILAGLFLPISVTGSAGIGLAFIGLLGAGGAAAAKYLMERAAQQRYEYCQKQLAVLRTQVRQATEERDGLDQDLPRGGGPLDVRLQAAEQELARLEESLPTQTVAAPQQAVAPPVVAAAPSIAAVAVPLVRPPEVSAAELQAARKRWRQALVAAGLAEDLTPKQVGQLSLQQGQALELLREIQRRREQLETQRRDLASMRSRVTQLMSDVELKPQGHTLGEHLRQMRRALADQATLVHQRDELARRHARLRRRHVRHTAALRRLQRTRRRLLLEAGVDDELQLRQHASRRLMHQRLVQERETLEREINAALAGVDREAAIGLLTAGGGTAPVDAGAQLMAELTAARRQLHELFELRGAMSQQIEGLAGDRRLAEKHLELSVVESRLHEAFQRWQVLAATSRLLERVREEYERNRQSEVLKEASTYMARLTQGNYTRVWSPLGEQSLRVDDANGDALSAAVLSRGTREQLFLSLRMALVSAFQRRGVDLPLVLDDVLVNFDAGRVKAAAEVLADFAAAGHQLLVFTCHEHMLEMFAAVDAQVRRLPDNAQPGQTVTVEERAPRPSKSRGKKKAAIAAEEAVIPAEPKPAAAPREDALPPVRVPLRARHERALPRIRPVAPSFVPPIHVPVRSKYEPRLPRVRPLAPIFAWPVRALVRASYEPRLPRIRPVAPSFVPPVRVPVRGKFERRLPRIRPVWSIVPPVRVPKPKVVTVERLLPAPASVLLADPPSPVRPPKFRVARPAPRMMVQTTERVGWSAEEFEGELDDRVVRNGNGEIETVPWGQRQLTREIVIVHDAPEHRFNGRNGGAVVELADADFEQ